MLNIEKYAEVINACRFCFMCRHLSAAGIATGRESDTPRVRALMAGRILHDRSELKNADFAQAVFEADLSGANRRNCVTHYDEIGLTLALRRDFLAAGTAPEAVRKLIAKLEKTGFGAEGEGDTVFLSSGYAPADRAARKLLGPCREIRGAEALRALKVLGADAAAAELFRRFKRVVAGAKQVVTNSGAVAAALRGDFKGVRVGLTCELLLQEAERGRLAKKSGKFSYIASDYLRNYGVSDAPEKLLAAVLPGAEPFGVSDENSYAAGEGAVVLDQLAPELVRAMAEQVIRFAPEAGRRVVTSSPYAARVLTAAGMKTITIEEALV